MMGLVCVCDERKLRMFGRTLFRPDEAFEDEDKSDDGERGEAEIEGLSCSLCSLFEYGESSMIFTLPIDSI